MKIKLKEIEKLSCLDKSDTAKTSLTHDETGTIELTTPTKNTHTVLYILKLQVARLARQLKNTTNINKYLNQELEIKSQLLATANTRISMLKFELHQKENLWKEISEDFKNIEDAVGCHGLAELKIAILKLQNLEELNKTNEDNSSQYNLEPKSEICRLNEMVNTLEVSNYSNKQLLEKEVERRSLLESEFKKTGVIVENLTSANIQFFHERDWNKAQRKILHQKLEELLRKNASLQEYSDSLREKYEALLLQKKRKKKSKLFEEIDLLEPRIKLKVEEIKLSKDKIKINDGLNNKYSKIIERADFDCEIMQSILVKNYNEEKEKNVKLEEKLEILVNEISILQEEKQNWENRLKSSEENYNKIKANFDEMSETNRNIANLKNQEQKKINERILEINKRLDDLGNSLIKRYKDNNWHNIMLTTQTQALQES